MAGRNDVTMVYRGRYPRSVTNVMQREVTSCNKTQKHKGDFNGIVNYCKLQLIGFGVGCEHYSDHVIHIGKKKFHLCNRKYNSIPADHDIPAFDDDLR